MQLKPTKLDGAFVVESRRLCDDRGWFARVFCADTFAAHGLETRFVQINHSCTRRRGSIRGLHFQLPPAAEVKLIRCTRGAVFDVIVDLRLGSPTLLRWLAVELRATDGRSLYVPRGFAHGFQALTDNAEVTYPTSASYASDHEGGVRWDDPAVGIRWPIAVGDAPLSPKDLAWPLIEPGFAGIDLCASC
jgi:dTDP-4-dehydrorhamnose 3,5-epimerase